MIEVLVGMIASGKSSYAKSAANQGKIVINDDSLVLSFHGGNYLLYDPKLKPFYKAVETNSICNALLAGKSVVIDKTNLSRESRLRYVSLAKILDVESKAVCFPVCSPELHAERRFQSDSRGYSFEHWIRVAQSHLREYTPVSPDEGFHNIIYK